MGWVTADSAYAAAARTLNLQYPSGTQDEPGFSPEQFSTTVESSLEARLEARLKREMERKEAESGESVSAS